MADPVTDPEIIIPLTWAAICEAQRAEPAQPETTEIPAAELPHVGDWMAFFDANAGEPTE